MEINVKEYLEIAGYPPQLEKEAAIGLGAHFEVVAREGDLQQAQTQLENVRAAYEWWQHQDKPNDPVFCENQDRHYRMMLWVAKQTVAVIETKDFQFPTHLKIDRKQTGAYYTPRSLIEALLDSALQPLLDDITKDNK